MVSYAYRIAGSYTGDMKSALRATTNENTRTKLFSRNYNHRDITQATKAWPEVHDGHLRVKINISGELYETLEATLARFPDTLLGCPEKRKPYFDENRQEYFFNRNRNAFDAILFYYQSYGLLTRPYNIRLQEFCDELRFFQIGQETLKEFMKDEGALDEDEDQELYQDLPTNQMLRNLWLWFEYPKYSKVSKIIACFSVAFIVISVYILCAETLEHDEIAGLQHVEHKKHHSTQYDDMETTCVIWFTLEFLFRAISCPNKLKFILDVLNIIDLVAIMPYYVRLALDEFKGEDVANYLLLLRMLRLFKLARHLDELKVLAETIRSTWRELLMILFFILMTTAIFSGWTFYVENEAQKESFSSIPATAWFVIVTISNVGYGDMVPVTLMGKLLGAVCTLAGVLVIALPSPVIVTKFRFFYEKRKKRKQATYKF